MRRLSEAVNAALGRLTPERRLIIRSADRADYLRLSPFMQTAGCALALALLGWTGYATYAHLTDSAAAHDAERRLAEMTAIYESRIAAGDMRTAALADALSSARQETEAALGRLSSRSVALADAVEMGETLDETVAVYRARLADLERRHGAALADKARIEARMGALEGDLAATTEDRAETEAELTTLADRLDQLAAERNARAAETAELSEKLAALQADFARRRDQQERIYSRLEDAARLGLAELEGVFKRSGVDIDAILSSVRKDYSGAGGLFTPLEETGFSDDADGDPRLDAVLNDLGRIAALRVAVERMPYARPVRAARFTSGFGPRRDPKNGRRAMHDGIDLAAPRGTAIYATGAGEVIYSGRQRGYGNVIKIRHAFGYETVYAHLNKRRVKLGDRVERGDRIGDMGSTGRSTGSHLHYEIRVKGKPVNPAKYIEAARNVL